MRIGLDLQSTRGPISGIGAYAQGLAPALEAAAAAGGRHEIVPLWYRGFRRWPAPAEMARTQVAMVGEAWGRRLDVIHSPGFAPPMWGRAPRVLSLHDLSVWQRPELLPPGPSRVYWGSFLPRAARRAACIVAPSRYSAGVIREALPFPAARVRHVAYPPRPLFRPAGARRQAALRRHFGLFKPYVLGLGALEPRKDWLGVLRAFARMVRMAPHCEHELVLAGGVNVAASAAAVEVEIERLELGTRVRRLGYVRELWLAPLYSAAAALVFPETLAGYGLPILEAFACGTPVVSYANTALPETAAGAAVLIPPPYAPADTAAALLEVISRPAQAAEMRRRGRARAAEFNWAVTAQAMLAIFEEFGRC